MTVNQLAPDDPLSPELVLVLPPELRAQVIAGLGPPVWPAPAQRVAAAAAVAAAPASGSRLTARVLGTMLMVRALQLALLFVAVTAATLILSAVAGAVP